MEELRAFLDQEVRDLQARVQQMLENKTMPIREQLLFDRERATEAQRNLHEAIGIVVIETSTRSTTRRTTLAPIYSGMRNGSAKPC